MRKSAKIRQPLDLAVEPVGPGVVGAPQGGGVGGGLTGWEQLAAAVQATEGLSAAQRRWIFSDTARRLYPGLGDGAGA